MIAGGGAGKGVAVLPDVGDEVVMLFPDGDLAHGLVLGGLYGKRAYRAVRRRRARARWSLPRAAGRACGLGAGKSRSSLSTADGDRAIVRRGPARLAVSGDLAISAIGGTITIQGCQDQV